MRPEPAAQATPPAPAARGEAWLRRVDQVLAWWDGWIARALPAEFNPLAQAGRAANFALLAAVVSGVVLLIWYSPSVQLAYPSLASLSGHTLGGWVRAFHRYSSDLVMLLLLVHAGRMFFARKFAGARWLPWVSGVALTALVWFIGWTGYWLAWDQPAQQVAVTSMRFLDGLPIFGEPLGRLFIADRLVPSLLFFVVFFLHMLLPLGLAIGLVVHLMRVSRAKLLPGRPLCVALAVGLAVAALLVPAPLDEPARMAVKAEHFTVDAWYLTPLALGLRLQHAGLWIALGGTLAGAAALPWLLGRRRPPVTYQAVVTPARCHACTQCVQDCPFDAIAMIARTDGKRFPTQAFVDPARCVGCGVCAGSCDSEGIVLPWFDTRREETRIMAEIGAALAHGAEPWVALVAVDIEGGWSHFATARWQQRLPGYQVQAVPTASWVPPKLVENVLRQGARGVLLVRDARAEAAARDGNRWVSARLAGERKPFFRPERAGTGSGWLVLDFDPSRPNELRQAAARFRTGAAAPVAAGARARGWRIAISGTALALAIGAAVVAPSHLRVTNPAAPEPEFIFSFKALGDFAAPAELDAAAEAKKPVHMRGRSTTKPQRAPVRVRVTLDGVTEERTYRAKGIANDGPALNQWRQVVSAGAHTVAIEVITGPDSISRQWQGTIDAHARHLHVLTFEPAAGFHLE